MDTEIIKNFIELYKNADYNEFYKLGLYVYKYMINSKILLLKSTLLK